MRSAAPVALTHSGACVPMADQGMPAAALAYAREGWPVFPCHPDTKRPLTPKGKDADGGFKHATTNNQQISEWWRRWPKATIGVPTGRAIGAFVIDIDAGTDETTGEVILADQIIAQLEREISASLPATWAVETPRGGRHLYFALPVGECPRNRTGIVSRVDVRGDGGYVIAPPSVRPDGRGYRWITKDREFAQAPLPLLDCIFRRGKWARNAVRAEQGAHPVRLDNPSNKAERNYALAALDNQIRNVERAGKGTRNQTLNDAALALAHLVAAGLLSEAVVRQLLENAACACGLAKEDGIASVRATITSGMKAGLAQPTDLSKIGRRAARRSAAPFIRPSRTGATSSSETDQPDVAPGDSGLDRHLAVFPRTDFGNVERYCARYGDVFKFCPAVGWLQWDGKRWSTVGAEAATERAAHATVRAIQWEAQAIRGMDADYEVETKQGTKRCSELLAGWGVTSEGSRHFGCLTKNARQHLQVEAAALDADPMKFNVANGTLVFRKTDDGSDYVKLQPHNPADLITKISPVVFDPTAECPLYDAFLKKVQPDKNTQRSLHQWAGLCLTGDIGEEKMAIFYGTGANGKTTWLETIAYVAGEYARVCQIETFLEQKNARRGDQATPDLARLAGARFVRTSEPDSGAKLAEPFVKLTTGGDMVTARALHREAFEFRPQFKLTISGNYKPRIRGTDDGIWRRLRLVPWKVTIPKEERDKHFKERLPLVEASGILNRVLDGLRDWMDHGLVDAEEMVEAIAEYRAENDVLGRFLEACTEIDPAADVSSTRLYGAYSGWARSEGMKPWTQTYFGTSMRERGFDRVKKSSMFFRGLRLNAVGDEYFAANLPEKASDPRSEDDNA
jgi:putative DNA primase/helicase